MLFEIFFWLILLTSFVCFMMDFARAKPDVDRNANFMYDFGMVLVMVCITLIVGRLVIMLADTGYLSSDLKAIIIAECFFMMIFRKILAVLVQGIVGYLCSVDNAFAQRVEPFLIIKTQDPLSPKPMQISLGVLRIGHTLIYVLCGVITAICSAIPGLTNSRINVLLNQVSNLIAKVVGTLGSRFIFMLWIIALVGFWVMIVVYIRKLYTNFLNLLEGDYSEIQNIKPLRWAIIIMFWARKLFSYIFIMTNYRLQDFVFWWFISVGVVAIVFWLWQRAKKRGYTAPSIW